MMKTSKTIENASEEIKYYTEHKHKKIGMQVFLLQVSCTAFLPAVHSPTDRYNFAFIHSCLEEVFSG